jgi:hypothetical protein
MKLTTAAKMMALLEQDGPPTLDDDAHFIIFRLLRAEIRKGNGREILEHERRAAMKATSEEVARFMVDKVGAVKAHRTRTQSGIRDAVRMLEAGVEEAIAGTKVLDAMKQESRDGIPLGFTELSTVNAMPLGVTSCG